MTRDMKTAITLLKGIPIRTVSIKRLTDGVTSTSIRIGIKSGSHKVEFKATAKLNPLNDFSVDLVLNDNIVLSEYGNKEAKELPKYIELTRELGEEYNILPTISLVGVDLEFDEKIAKKTNKARKILIEEAKKYKDPLLSIPCYAPWYYLMVRADGSVLHCGEWEEPLENIRKKSLKEVWFGKKFEEVRKNKKIIS